MDSTFASFSGSMGLETWAFMPLANERFTSSANAFALVATMGTSAASARPRLRMRCAAVSPSMTGIMTSIKTMS